MANTNETLQDKLIKLQIRNEKWGFWIKNLFFAISGIFAFWVYYDSTKPQTSESMNRERARFMWDVRREKNPEDQAFGWKLIESVYEIKANNELEKLNKRTKEDIDRELEIKKQELNQLIEKSNDPVDKETYRLRLKTLEKLYE